MNKLPQVQVVAPSRSKAPAAIVISEGAAAKPETSGIKRGAKMWSAMAKAAFVISALLCAVSAAFMVDLASDLGKSWWEVVTLSAIALALSGLSPLLLAFAAFLEDTRPAEAARIVQGW
jgi:Mg-chelatase subunit ChlD